MPCLQVRVVGTASEVVGVTLETKPRRKSKRNVLFDMTPSYRDGLVSAGDMAQGWHRHKWAQPHMCVLPPSCQAQGVWHSPSARDAHMLLQNELFLNVATKDWVEGELRGQVISLPYSGLLARYTGTWGEVGGGRAQQCSPSPITSHRPSLCTEMPVPLAGQLVSPAVSSGAGGHAWLSLDEHCHLHYEIVVAGLGRPADGTVSAQLHGVAELGEMGSRPHLHKRMLKGFYGTEVRRAHSSYTTVSPQVSGLSPHPLVPLILQAQGVVKDLDAELLQHLAQGTAFLQVSTKAHPRGEMRGWVCGPDTSPGVGTGKGGHSMGTCMPTAMCSTSHGATVPPAMSTPKWDAQPGAHGRNLLLPSRCTSPTAARQEGPACPPGRLGSQRAPKAGM